MDASAGRRTSGPRCIALVGPYLSGKTTLLEAILFAPARSSARARYRDRHDRRRRGAGSARPRHERRDSMSPPPISWATRTPSSIARARSNSSQEARAALAGCDAAVVVCEPDDKKVAGPAADPQAARRPQDSPLHLPQQDRPQRRPASRRARLSAARELQAAGAAPDPDLEGRASWRASSISRSSAPSSIASMRRAKSSTCPADMLDLEKEARFAMLEKLADYDDELMEQLLSDIEPPRDRVFADLTRELAEGLITPVLFGSAENGNGILRLLKALRHEAPDVEATAKRLGLKPAMAARRAGAQDLSYRPWRQAVAGPRARRRPRRRRDVLWRPGPGSAHRRPLHAHGLRRRKKIAKAQGRRHRRARHARRHGDGRDRVDRQGLDEAADQDRGIAPASTAWPSRSPTARTR